MRTWQELAQDSAGKRLLTSFEADVRGDLTLLESLYAEYSSDPEKRETKAIWREVYRDAGSLYVNLLECPRSSYNGNPDFGASKIRRAISYIRDLAKNRITNKESGGKEKRLSDGRSIRSFLQYYWVLSLLPYFYARQVRPSCQRKWLCEWLAFQDATLVLAEEDVRQWERKIFSKLIVAKKIPIPSRAETGGRWDLKDPVLRPFTRILVLGKGLMSKAEYKRAKCYVFEKAPALRI